MTQNQLRYWELKESQRSHMADESIRWFSAATDAAYKTRAAAAQEESARASTNSSIANLMNAETNIKDLANRQIQAEASMKQANVAEQDLANRAMSASAALLNAQASNRQASVRESYLAIDEAKAPYEIQKLSTDARWALLLNKSAYEKNKASTDLTQEQVEATRVSSNANWLNTLANVYATDVNAEYTKGRQSILWTEGTKNVLSGIGSFLSGASHAANAAGNFITSSAQAAAIARQYTFTD